MTQCTHVEAVAEASMAREEHRMDRSIRRWTIQVFVLLALGGLVQLSSLLHNARQGPNRPPNLWPKPIIWLNRITLVLFVTGSALLVVLAHRWRLRIDDEGIWRRRLRRWDWWPWEAFQSGRVHKWLLPYSFHYSENHRGGRTLLLMLLNDDALPFVSEVCRRLWRPPPPPPIPKEATLCVPKSGPFARRIQISGLGLHIGSKRTHTRTYGWNEVEELCVTRMEHDEPGFQRMLIKLPDRTIKLQRLLLDRLANWSGPNSQVVMGLLKRFLSSEVIRVKAAFGPLRERSEFNQRDKSLRRQMLWSRVSFWISTLPANIAAMAILWTGRVDPNLQLPLKFRLELWAMSIMAAVVLWLVLAGPWWVLHRLGKIVLIKEQKMLRHYRAAIE